MKSLEKSAQCPCSPRGYNLSLVTLFLLTFVSSYLAAGLTHAAGPASGLQGLVPGQIERQVETMEEPERQKASPVLPDEARTRVELAEQSFTLAGILVEGATAYSNLEFLSLYRSYLGRRTTVQDLRDIAETITRHYQNDGYFLSHAFVPAQNIEFGLVRIRVIEGRIEDWRFTDAGMGHDPLIDRMLQPVLRQRPVHKPDLMTVLRRINALPGLTVTPELRSVPDRLGVHELQLATETRHFAGTLGIDNRGSEFIGPVRESASMRVSNLTGRHEYYQLKLTTAGEHDELVYLDASTEWLLAASGLRLRLSATHIRSRPGGDLAPLDVLVTNDRYRLGLSCPLYQSVNGGRYIGGYLETYQSRTDVQSVRRLEDELHKLRMHYRQAWAIGKGLVRSLLVSVTRGLPVADSRVVDTQTGDGVGRPDFTSLGLKYVNRRRVGERWEVTASFEGQYAAHELPSSERYSIGGGRFGSAYDPSEITGDHGAAGRLELAHRDRRSVDGWRLRWYGAYDIGAVWDRVETTGQGRVSVASLSLGVRVAATNYWASLELAKPLTRAVASQGVDGEDVRAFASTGYRF